MGFPGILGFVISEYHCRLCRLPLKGVCKSSVPRKAYACISYITRTHLILRVHFFLYYACPSPYISSFSSCARLLISLLTVRLTLLQIVREILISFSHLAMLHVVKM